MKVRRASLPSTESSTLMPYAIRNPTSQLPFAKNGTAPKVRAMLTSVTRLGWMRARASGRTISQTSGG